MRKILTMLAVGVLMIAGIPALSMAADEELFDTKAAAVHFEKGIENLKDKKYDDAIKEFEDAVDINPDAEGYYYLGYAYYMKGRQGDGESRKRSIECFDKAYELDPSFTPSRLKAMESEKTMPEPATQETTSPETQPAAAPSAPSDPSEEPAQSDPDSPAQPAPQDEPADTVENGNAPSAGD